MSDQPQRRFMVGDVVRFTRDVEYVSFGGNPVHHAQTGYKSRVISLWDNGIRLSCGIRLPLDTDAIEKVDETPSTYKHVDWP